MSSGTYLLEKFERELITDEMIQAAAAFYSSHYGVWGPLAAEKVLPLGRVKQGDRVKMSPKTLREKILPPDEHHAYVRVADENGQLVGNLFATSFAVELDDMWTEITWITQLCVHKEHRNRGIAKQLVTALRKPNNNYIGMLSPHPFAIKAITGVTVAEPACPEDLVWALLTPDEMKQIMALCPIAYVSDAKPRGSFFDEAGHVTTDGSILCADTGFWVDHQETETALEIMDQAVMISQLDKWYHGQLPEGHEFLMLTPRSQPYVDPTDFLNA